MITASWLASALVTTKSTLAKISGSSRKSGAIPAWLNWKTQHFDADGNYSHDPISHQQAAGAALKARSAKGAPSVLDPADYLK